MPEVSSDEAPAARPSLQLEEDQDDAASTSSKESPHDRISPKGVGKGRSNKNLEDLLRKRREGCVEFESAPATSSASDAKADDPSAKGPSAPAASSAGVGLSPTALQELLRKRREACEVLESSPDDSTADAVAQEAEAAAGEAAAKLPGRLPQHRPAEEHEASGTSGGGVNSRSEIARRSKKTNDELKGWLAQLHGRCQVLESSPEDTSADAVATQVDSYAEEVDPESCAAGLSWRRPSVGCADAGADADVRQPERAPGGGEMSPPHGEEAAPEASLAEDQRLQEGAAPAAHEDAKLEEVHQRLQEGCEPLSGEERAQVWAKQLPVAAADETKQGMATGLVQDLISGEGLSPKGDASTAKLAAAFANRHLHWLVAAREIGAEDADKQSAELFTMLAQLLRYHYPSVAVAVEKDAEVPVGNGLAVALEVGCGGVAGLGKILLSPKVGDGESNALRLLCDLAVLETREALLLFVAVELIAEARRRLGKTAFQQLRDRGLAGRGSAGVRQVAEGAILLHDATPLSLIFALSSGGWATARLQKLLPICSVAADEVLHHVYERKAGSWRLVVVDVRGRPKRPDGEEKLPTLEDFISDDKEAAKPVSLALPVCLRLDPTQDREAVLKDMPFNESIHLCLLGDHPPGPGEHAFELCHALVTSTSGERRAHLSVAEGGWAAIENLARTLELELMRMDPEEGVSQERPKRGGQGGLQKAKKVLSRALGGFGGGGGG